MAIVKERREIKWFDRYWVQPGELAVKIDGGSTKDRNGNPYLYRQGDVVRPTVRVFPRGRRQELVVFDAKRQAQPVRLDNEQFLLPIEGLTVSLTASIYYRIRNPIPLLESITLETLEDVQVAIRDRVRDLISRIIKENSLALFLQSQEDVRNLLLNNSWVAESELVLEDIAIYNLQPPQQLVDVRHQIAAQVMLNEAQVEMLLRQGIDPTFDYMQRNYPGFTEQILATTGGLFQTLLQRPDAAGKYAKNYSLEALATEWTDMVTRVKQNMVGGSARAFGAAASAPFAIPVSNPPGLGGPQPALPAAQPQVITAPQPVPVPQPSAPPAAPPQPAAAATSRFDEEVSLLTEMGYTPTSTTGGTVTLQMNGNTVTIHCPAGYPAQPPEVTVTRPDGSSESPSLPSLTPWDPKRHLISVLRDLNGS